ncbi:MAG: LysM peptidoglycan-binding domain-containing protein, partial [Moorellaceae bacterium]
ANGLANPNYIYVGQTLIIPVASAPAPAGGTTYVVQEIKLTHWGTRIISFKSCSTENEGIVSLSNLMVISCF